MRRRWVFLTRQRHQTHITANLRVAQQARGVAVLEWPSLTRDLNQKEDLWTELKIKFGRRQSSNLGDL